MRMRYHCYVSGKIGALSLWPFAHALNLMSLVTARWLATAREDPLSVPFVVEVTEIERRCARNVKRPYQNERRIHQK